MARKIDYLFVIEDPVQNDHGCLEYPILRYLNNQPAGEQHPIRICTAYSLDDALIIEDALIQAYRPNS